MVRIRDPIHGTQKVTKAEISIVDHPAVQRLRGIKQLGMADFAYPGATHTRYAHALGVMHVAGRVFDAVSVDLNLHPADRHRLCSTLRLAALFHDLGHAPLSHSTELMMPEVSALGLGSWTQGRPDRRASHEDYTLAIVLHSDLTRRIETAVADDGVEAEDVAALLTDHPPPGRA
ncbi:MAG: HD domain-containing protein, partial [Myxococcota bacterium]